jgi:hypothetical protein
MLGISPDGATELRGASQRDADWNIAFQIEERQRELALGMQEN